MKTYKILLICILSVLSVNLSAQLKVESTGKVKIGSGSLRLQSTSDDWGFIYMGDSHYRGLRFTPSGKMYLYNSDPSSFITVTSATTQRNLIVMDPNGIFKFWVKADGCVYSVNQYITSDSTKKENVLPITGAIEKIKQIKGITYNLKNDSENQITPLKEEVQREENTDNLPDEQEKKRSAGVFAQDIEKVLPEAVRTLEDGSKVVSYNDLVALLVEAIKEQQAKIEELTSHIESIEEDCCNASTDTKSAEILTETDSNLEIQEARLYQNTPNPFSASTTIRYYVPPSINNATINIYNMNGTQLKSILLHQTGEGSIEINGGEFNAGMYLYALIANGQIIDTKRMILTD